MNATRRVIPIPAHEESAPRLSQAEFLASLVSKTAKTQERAAARAMTNRIPASDYCRVKALSDYSGLSMNQTVTHLLRVGLEALTEALPPSDYEAVSELSSRVFADEFRMGDFDQYGTDKEPTA